MALDGSVNTGIVATLRSFETPAVGISGVDAHTIVATRRPPVEVEGRTVDYGNVGDIVEVDPALIDSLLEDGRLPVVSPLSADADGNVLNVNADSVASKLATALGAEKLIFLTKTAGHPARPERPDVAPLLHRSRRLGATRGAGYRERRHAAEDRGDRGGARRRGGSGSRHLAPRVGHASHRGLHQRGLRHVGRAGDGQFAARRDRRWRDRGGAVVMPLSRDEVLALHRAWVEIPSVSHQEQEIADFVERSLRDHTMGCEASKVTVDRFGDNVVAVCESVDATPRPRVPPQQPPRHGSAGRGLDPRSVASDVWKTVASTDWGRTMRRRRRSRCLLPSSRPRGAGGRAMWR